MQHYLVVHDAMDSLMGSSLCGAMKSYLGWRRIADNCYVIASIQSADAVYTHIRGYIDDWSHLYIFDLGPLWYGSAPVEVGTWLDHVAEKNADHPRA
jgi:hypothetical protein